MGRTLPSITQMVYQHIEALTQLSLALRRSDQVIMERFFEAILQHRVAIGNADCLIPMQLFPFVILIEERKRVDSICAEIRREIDELKQDLNKL